MAFRAWVFPIPCPDAFHVPRAWLPVCIPFPTSCSDCFIKTILKATQYSVTQLYCSLFNWSLVSGPPGVFVLCPTHLQAEASLRLPSTTLPSALSVYTVLPLFRAARAGMVHPSSRLPRYSGACSAPPLVLPLPPMALCRGYCGDGAGESGNPLLSQFALQLCAEL